MSNPDSFLDEVAEEVRKDRLTRLARRYGWIVALVVVVIVGAVSWSEWRKATDKALAEAFGDGLLYALQYPTPAGRSVAAQSLPAEGDGVYLRDLLAAGELAASDSREAAQALQTIMDTPEIPQLYRDLALLKLLQLPEPTVTTSERIDLLAPMIQPGNPFRIFALELKSLIHIERRESDAAIADLQTILSDVESSAGQQDRARQLLFVLGVPTEAL